MVNKTTKAKTMIEQNAMTPVVITAAPQSANSLPKAADLDRWTLADVNEQWVNFQSSRDRSAIYSYLHIVFELVEWWSKHPSEREEALQIVKGQNPKLATLPADPYAEVIACTADPKKVDGKTRSKWSRVLRYVAEFKSETELLRDFVPRKGGINKCATRYTRRLGRNSKTKATQRKKRAR
jgi:hypothetical protein